MNDIRKKMHFFALCSILLPFNNYYYVETMDILKYSNGRASVDYKIISKTMNLRRFYLNILMI